MRDDQSFHLNFCNSVVVSFQWISGRFMRLLPFGSCENSQFPSSLLEYQWHNLQSDNFWGFWRNGEDSVVAEYPKRNLSALWAILLAVKCREHYKKRTLKGRRDIFVKFQLKNSNRKKSGPNEGETHPLIAMNGVFRAHIVRGISRLVQAFCSGSAHFFCDWS